MNLAAAVALLDRLHDAQNEFYAGGSGAALKELLASTITWTVPGESRIAGTYRGLGEVFSYFRTRRDLADRTFRMKRRDVLVGTGERIAALTDGFATIRDVEHRWSTWACTTSSISGSEPAGCSRSTSARLTRSGPLSAP